MLQINEALLYLWCCFEFFVFGTVWSSLLRPRPLGCHKLGASVSASVGALDKMRERSIPLSTSLPFLMINSEHVASAMMQHTEDHST